ncbi:MAG: 4'-phosphopantetheinyl transferase superfamily protein [Bacteroidales bacterium]|nr:4'-phosphopantetheinyl transferase superfamily protein [Bacteroidales bacterium]
MALILNEHLESECQLGIWEIQEDYDNLLNRLALLPEEIKVVENFRNYDRKLEWLSVRVLLNAMTQKELTITYNGNRKPYVQGDRYNISISHSKDLTAILLSRKKRVGIDMEYMSHRISRIAHRFINSDEIISEEPDLSTFHMYIHWCAKEALYKICDKQDIQLKENITIEPFYPKQQGTLTGWVRNRFRNDHFMMEYIKIDNYVVVWSSK